MLNEQELYFTLKVYRGPEEGTHKTLKGDVPNFPFKFDLEFTYPFEPANDGQSQNRGARITKENVASEMSPVFKYLSEVLSYIHRIDEVNINPEEPNAKERQAQIDRLRKVLASCDNINRITYSQFSPGSLNVTGNVELIGNGDLKPPRYE